MKTSGKGVVSLEELPNVTTEDKLSLTTAIQEAGKGQPVLEDSCRMMANKIGSFLDKETDVPLSGWDKDIVLSFARYAQYISMYNVVRCKKVLGIALRESGNPMDLSFLTPESFDTMDEDIFVTFGAFHSLVLKRISDEFRPYTQVDDLTMTYYSTPLALYYLSWLGFTGEEIVEMTQDNYDPASGIISYSGKTRDASQFRPINDFFAIYTKSTDYLSPYGDKLRRLSYKSNECLVKQIRTGKVTRIHNYSALGKKLFGCNPTTLLTSGRFDRLLKYELEGGVVDFDHGDEIADYLGIGRSEPRNYRKTSATAASTFIKRYSKYKKIRLNLLGD